MQWNFDKHELQNQFQDLLEHQSKEKKNDRIKKHGARTIITIVKSTIRIKHNPKSKIQFAIQYARLVKFVNNCSSFE